MEKHSNLIDKSALILEGGGFRGVFTAGVLDVLMENNIYDFASVYGTSAGALMAESYISRQVGRNMRVSLAFRDDPRYMSAKNLVTTQNILGAEFLYEHIQNTLDPFDFNTFNASNTKLYACSTDVTFGKADYVLVDKLPEMTEALRASTALPVVSSFVYIDGRPHLDGGSADSVPVEEALKTHDKAVVVLTQDRSYVKKPYSQYTLASAMYSDYPYFLEQILTRHDRYNEQREHIWDLERQGKILVIAPEKPVTVENIEHEGAPLLDLYIQGRKAAEKLGVENIRKFIS